MQYNNIRPYGFIYITTNMINGKKYIGQKKFDDKWKNYVGSGYNLKKAIEKYGKENFIKEIIYIAYTKDELDKAEIDFINLHDAVESNDYYNIALGGQGGAIWKEHPYSTKTPEELFIISKKISNSKITKIKCIETNEVFDGYENAENFYDLPKGSITKYFNGRYRSGIPSNKFKIHLSFLKFDNGNWIDRVDNNITKKKKHSRRVKCIENGMIFDTIKEAEEYFKLKERSISAYLNKKAYKNGIKSGISEEILTFKEVLDEEIYF